METSECQTEKMKPEMSCDSSTAAHHTPKKKRKRKHSGGEGDHAKHHGGKHGHRPPSKKFKHNYGMSSTKLANNIMRFRLGGSVSDPLNLEGDAMAKLGDDCSTCAPSPAGGPEVFGQPSPLPFHLQHDPLNLEGTSEDFPANKTNKHVHHHGLHHHYKHGKPGHKKRPGRRRTISKTEEQDKQEVGGASLEKTSATVTPPSEKAPPSFNSKMAKFRYGNYDRYYGYRNSGVSEEDIRLSMLCPEWFTRKDCLDIGCNTGQVTMCVARDFNPRRVVGMDIDSKLVKIAWKNLYRDYYPTMAPDGRPFPVSITQTRGPMTIPVPSSTSALPTTQEVDERASNASTSLQGEKSEAGFPNNVEFVHGNYVPSSDSALDQQLPEFDVILALSLTKWIHLNWGDEGIKRFFRKVFLHLRPGGRFIVEPQPFTSYAKKKKVSAEVYENYQHIEFRPEHFHDYLLSSEVGFRTHKFIGIPPNKSKGFRRPLHMYMKAGSEGVASTPADCETCDSPLSGNGVRKMKSVVMIVQDRTASNQERKNSNEMETEGCDDGRGSDHGKSGEP